MVQDRLDHNELRDLCGYLTISNYQDFGLDSPHTCVCQAAKRQLLLKFELQNQQGLIGRRLERGELSTAEFMIRTAVDILTSQEGSSPLPLRQSHLPQQHSGLGRADAEWQMHQ